MHTLKVKPLVLIVENSKSCQEVYLKRLSPLATIKSTLTFDGGAEIIGRYFREDVILVLDGTLVTHLDGLRLLEIAKRIATQHKFSPIIIAGSSTAEDNTTMCEHGCTHNPVNKTGIVKIVEKLMEEKPQHNLKADTFYN